MNPEKLQFWIDKGYNVLFEGKHGTGKTTCIIEAFKKANLKYLYFSCSTLDPFIDFCGVPVKAIGESGETIIDMILPKQINPNEVEAIFLDEYSRGAKKVKNATMELIQFRTINGRFFPKLKVIWAAINPDDSDLQYDVDKLDPAQRDRFHIQIQIPYKLNSFYFKNKYGLDNSKAANEWWERLPDDVKNEVSPRRLDYALTIFTDGGDIADVLPAKSNPSALKRLLHHGSLNDRVKKYFIDKEVESAKQLALDPHSFDNLIDIVSKNNALMDFYLPMLPKEKLASVVSEKSKVGRYIISDIIKDSTSSIYSQMITDIYNAKLNKKLNRFLEKEAIPAIHKANSGGKQIYATKMNHSTKIDMQVAICAKTRLTTQRYNAFKELENVINGYLDALDMTDMNNILNCFDKIVNSSHMATLKRDYGKMYDLYYKIICKAKERKYQHKELTKGLKASRGMLLFFANTNHSIYDKYYYDMLNIDPESVEVPF